jgi:hypothetical protein
VAAAHGVGDNGGMSEKFVALTVSCNLFQKTVIEGVLRHAGIPFHAVERGPPAVGLAVAGFPIPPLSFEEVQVPSDRLQEAKDALCAQGIVCEVSERLLRRTLEEVIKPLLASAERDLTRLIYIVGVNNKETVRAIFDCTLRESGGRELLEELFFELSRDPSAGLNALASALRGKESSGFGERFESTFLFGPKEVRLALLSVLPELSRRPWLWKSLEVGLLDRDGDLRQAASEAVFSLGLDDHDYDPTGPPGEREVAVREILQDARVV